MQSFGTPKVVQKKCLVPLKCFKLIIIEIHNTFITQHSNGPLEGLNNKIKAIKRASFGYRSFLV